MPFELSSILDSNDPSLFEFQSRAAVIRAPLPLTPDQLRVKSDAATMRAFEPKVVARIKDLTTRLSR